MSNITYRPIADLKKLPNNPRVIRDNQFKKLCDSVRDNPEYFAARPIILSDRTGELIIIAGNQRYEAAKALGLDQVPTFLLSGLSEAKEREIVIRDNVNNGEWDMDLLANEWNQQDLADWGIDVAGWHIEPQGDTTPDLRDDYSPKVGEVIYEPKETKHRPADLFTRESRFDAEISAINDEQIREMLRARASFFSTFNYAKIADYYAYQATQEEKALFEKLALVILDRDGLIENGFAEIINAVQEENGFTPETDGDDD